MVHWLAHTIKDYQCVLQYDASYKLKMHIGIANMYFNKMKKSLWSTVKNQRLLRYTAMQCI